MLPRRARRLTECFVLAMVVLAACVTTGAQAQSFQAQNVLVTDYVNSVGRTYTATLQYWAASGQEAILYTVPYSSSSFLIFEDFASVRGLPNPVVTTPETYLLGVPRHIHYAACVVGPPLCGVR
jgi:hypothetical protein